jgi:glycosyltransferase involved in cell wall biosynthesis
MKLSVAIITYNHERFIAQAIESVLSQRVNFSYEIIIGEDCSTDGTRGVIADFALRHPQHIKTLLRNKNIGANRNFAETFAACRGEYVAYLEGDDYWTSVDKLQRQIDFLDADSSCAISCTHARVVDEIGGAPYDTLPAFPAGRYELADLLKTNFVMPCTMVLRRALVGNLPNWLLKMKIGDWPLCALVARYGSIDLTDEITAAYRIHAGGVWSSLARLQRLNEVARMFRNLDKELEFKYSSLISATTAPPYLQFALEARSEGKRIEAARHLTNWLRNGGLQLPVNPRLPIGLATYVLIGSGYKLFSRANSTVHE